MKKMKIHYCPTDRIQTPCGRRWVDVKTTPLADLRFMTCKSCKKHVKKLKEEKHMIKVLLGNAC